MPLLAEALEGRLEMLRAIFGGREDPAPPRPQDDLLTDPSLLKGGALDRQAVARKTRNMFNALMARHAAKKGEVYRPSQHGKERKDANRT